MGLVIKVLVVRPDAQPCFLQHKKLVEEFGLDVDFGRIETTLKLLNGGRLKKSWC